MALVDKEAIREYKREQKDREDDRAERLDRFADEAAEANRNLESPPGATGPGWVPAAGGDPDTATRSAKVAEAVADPVLAANRRGSDRDDWERATDVKPARKSASASTSDGDGNTDPNTTGERVGEKPAETDAEREEREKREAADKREAAKTTPAETVQGRRTATKSTT